MIARALYHRAKVLVLDEPSASLSDAEVRLHCMPSVRQLAAMPARPIVYVSHRLREIVDLTDRVVGNARRTRRARAADIGAGPSPVRGRDYRRPRHRAAHSKDAEGRAHGGRPKPVEEILRVQDLTRPGKSHGVDSSFEAGRSSGWAVSSEPGRSETVRMLAGVDRQGGERSGERQKVSVVAAACPQGRASCSFRRTGARGPGARLLRSRERDPRLAGPRFRVAGVSPDAVPAEGAAAPQARWLSRLEITYPGTEVNVATLSGGNQQKVVLARWLDLPVESSSSTSPPRVSTSMQRPSSSR